MELIKLIGNSSLSKLISENGPPTDSLATLLQTQYSVEYYNCVLYHLNHTKNNIISILYSKLFNFRMVQICIAQNFH